MAPKKPSLRLRTQMSLEALEGLLERVCKNPVDVTFEGLEDDAGQSRKVITLAFSHELDRESFRAAMGRGS